MKLHVIVGSTRQGRISHKVGAWVAKEASAIEGIQIEVVDLADYPMPLFDEAVSPQYNPDRQATPEVQKWLDKVAEADGYILVTPEYNRSTSGVIKNAIDYLDYQIANKPVGLVGHGSTGGAQAVSHLRGIIPGALGVTVPKATYFSDRVADHIDDEGNLSHELTERPYGPRTAVQTTVKDTIWYTKALAAARKI